MDSATRVKHQMTSVTTGEQLSNSITASIKHNYANFSSAIIIMVCKSKCKYLYQYLYDITIFVPDRQNIIVSSFSSFPIWQRFATQNILVIR